MVTISLEKAIKLICVTAESFPMGVQAAHGELHSQIPNIESRQFYGISHGNTEGGIVYKAAVNALTETEADELELESFTIKEGKYLSEVVSDYMKNVAVIGQTFQKMLQHSELDPHGYCVEMYKSRSEVECLVKIRD